MIAEPIAARAAPKPFLEVDQVGVGTKARPKYRRIDDRLSPALEADRPKAVVLPEVTEPNRVLRAKYDVPDVFHNGQARVGCVAVSTLTIS